MKILISSHAFLPSIGGLENVSAMLADEFVRRGHEVRLVTQTDSVKALPLAYPVIRRPGLLVLLSLLRWCDVYFHNNLSLRSAWPLIFVRRPWVVCHQTWIPHDGWAAWRGKLKQWALSRATCISISEAIANHLRAPSAVIGNPYDDSVFRVIPQILRDGQLVFCGRLVSGKGVDVLLKALWLLSSRDLHPRLTVIGCGPEEQGLRAMASALELAKQVVFAGPRTGQQLAETLNAHRILVVPSTWEEPFGIVALEGIACGCVVVGSQGGGLKDAIGPCGVTFPNGDAEGLAARLEHLLTSPESLAVYGTNAEAHLSAYARAAVAEEYLRVFTAAIERRRPKPSRETFSDAESFYGFRY